MVSYPLPPPGPWRAIAEILQEGVLAPHNAQSLVRQGIPWPLVAAHVLDRAWWQEQRPAFAPPPTLPWTIRAWDAALQLEAPGLCLCVDPGPEAPLPVSPRPPDLIVVTHAHHDHTARLGEYSAFYQTTPVVMSHETSVLLSWPAYSDPSLRECLEKRTVRLHLGEERKIGGIRLRLLLAGHLLGAAMLEIGLREDTLLLTGEFALRDVGGLPGASWPTGSYPLVIMEATEAEWRSLPLADPAANRQPFLQEIAGLVNEGKTRLVAPAFSMGQAQELYAGLVLAQQAGAFPSFRVRLAGRAAAVSELYHEALGAQLGPWECRPLTLVADDVPANSLVVASGLDSDGEGGVASRLAATLMESEGTHVIWHPSVHTHAGWGERMAVAAGLPCHSVLFYHGTPSLSLVTTLSGMGRKVEHLSVEAREWSTDSSL